MFLSWGHGTWGTFWDWVSVCGSYLCIKPPRAPANTEAEKCNSYTAGNYSELQKRRPRETQAFGLCVGRMAPTAPEELKPQWRWWQPTQRTILLSLIAFPFKSLVLLLEWNVIFPTVLLLLFTKLCSISVFQVTVPLWGLLYLFDWLLWRSLLLFFSWL